MSNTSGTINCIVSDAQIAMPRAAGLTLDPVKLKTYRQGNLLALRTICVVETLRRFIVPPWSRVGAAPP